ncbi:hypothetical protein B7463_g1594, partial [Scytalidium lignicola]
MNNRVEEEMKDEVPPVPPGTQLSTKPTQAKQGKPWEALRISVFEVIDDPKYVQGLPHRDWVWFSGFAVILVQMVIATLPWILNDEWGTFLITACGNFLALLQGSLPQWKEEKWACPKQGGATVTLTQGNGSRHAMLILGEKESV